MCCCQREEEAVIWVVMEWTVPLTQRPHNGPQWIHHFSEQRA